MAGPVIDATRLVHLLSLMDRDHFLSHSTDTLGAPSDLVAVFGSEAPLASPSRQLVSHSLLACRKASRHAASSR
jgi:hypothetical protein